MPTPMQYVALPYVSQSGRSLADLLRMQGQQRAEAELRRGDIAAQMWANIGNSISGAVQGYQQQKERDLAMKREKQQQEAADIQLREAKREESGRAFERSMVPLALQQTEDGTYTYDRDLLTKEFASAGMSDRLPNVLKGLDTADAAVRQVNELKKRAFAGLAFSALQLGGTPEAVDEALKYNHINGLVSREDLDRFRQQIGGDPQKTERVLFALAMQEPEFVKILSPEGQTVSAGSALVDPRTGRELYRAPSNPMSVRPGGALVDPQSGKAIYQAPPPSPRPVSVGEGAKLVDPVTGQVIAQGNPKREPQGPMTRYTPVEVTRADGTVTPANYDAMTGTYHDVDTGEVLTGLKGKTTAEMKNRQDSLRGLVPTLKNMRAMSDDIIARVGPAQRADAMKRGVEAVFGNDPTFRTYQDFRNSLGVMIAVATQGSRPSDADVFRAALPMVPDPYRDTKESQQQKWGLIFDMFGARLSPEMKQQLGLSDAGGGGPQPPPSAAPPSGGVRMRAPDGRELVVPQNKVDEAKRRGAKVIG